MLDGKALILGGFSSGSVLPAAFVYLIEEDRFLPLPSQGALPGVVPRLLLYHTAVALQGKAWVFGGESGVGSANSKMATQELWQVEIKQRRPAGIEESEVTEGQDFASKVEGSQSRITSAFGLEGELYLEWTKIKPLKFIDPRKHHAACQFGPHMIVSGGLPDDSVIPYKDFHAYSPETNEWTQLASEVDWKGLSNFTMTPVYNSSPKSFYEKSQKRDKARNNKAESSEVFNEGLYLFGGLKPNHRPSNELVLVDTFHKPWRRKNIQPLGQPPKEMYDHCAHYFPEMRGVVIYGGRNHRLFSARGMSALSDIYILDVNFLVWHSVKANNSLGMERYLFSSFIHDHKLYVFGGLNDSNFLGFNISRLELVESEAKFIKNIRPDERYTDVAREIKRKKQQLETARLKDYDNILEMVHQKQNQREEEIGQSPGPVRPLEEEKFMYRGFTALPDPFLDVMNKKGRRRL